jgi:hypothetical protein
VSWNEAALLLGLLLASGTAGFLALRPLGRRARRANPSDEPEWGASVWSTRPPRLGGFRHRTAHLKRDR